MPDAARKSLPEKYGTPEYNANPTLLDKAETFYNENKDAVLYGGLAVAGIAAYFLFFKKKKRGK